LIISENKEDPVSSDRYGIASSKAWVPTKEENILEGNGIPS
jgi:hypothetical protein